MSTFITKVLLHPLFRFFFWTGAAVWLFLMGLAESGFVRWVDFILAVILLSTAAEKAVDTVTYFRNDHIR